MRIDREELHWLYIEWVHRVSDELDHKIKFTTEEIVDGIAHIIETNPKIINHDN